MGDKGFKTMLRNLKFQTGAKLSNGVSYGRLEKEIAMVKDLSGNAGGSVLLQADLCSAGWHMLRIWARATAFNVTVH